MRTTLTVEDDVAVKLKRLAKGRSFKATVNEVLRAGLLSLESGGTKQAAYHTEAVSGQPRLKNLDNIAEVLAETESEHWR